MSQKDKKEENGRGRFFFRAACFLVVVLAVIQIWAANRLATKGDVVRKYEIEASWLEKENQKMENEIIGLSSLSQIASRSGDLVFKQGVTMIYLPRPVIVAFKEESE